MRSLIEHCITDYKSARAVIAAMPVKPDVVVVTEDVWRKIFERAKVVKHQRGEDSPVEIRMRWGGVSRIMILDGVRVHIQKAHYRMTAPEN